MGRKVPVANDGSNYYQARQFNDPYDRDNGNPCVEVSGSSYTRQNSAYTLVSAPKHGKDTFVGADFTFNGNFQSLTFVTRDTWTVGGSFTMEARLGEPVQWVSENGTYLTLEQQQALQEQYVAVPDHEFTPNFWGQCDLCPAHNMYRREISAHLFVIQETPDWLHELAS